MDGISAKAQYSKIIAELDEKIPSPEKRAAHIFDILRREHPELTDWDLLCFSTNYIGYMSEAMPWLTDGAKKLNQLVYTAHYVATEESNANSTGVHTKTESQHQEGEREHVEKRSSLSDGLGTTFDLVE